MITGVDAGTAWIEVLWAVPAAAVGAGLALGVRRPRLGATVVVVGGLLLGPNTLLYLGLGGVDSRTLLLLGCQITLIGVGVAGLVASRGAGRSVTAWVVLLVTPLLVLAVTLGGMRLLWTPEGRAEAAAFPRVEVISYEDPGRGVTGTWVISATYDVPLAEALNAQQSALEGAGWEVRTEGWEATAEGGIGEATALSATKPGWLAELGFEQFGEEGAPAQGSLMITLWPQ